MEVLVKACEAEEITVIMVTHDESLAKYATRVVRLDSGKIISDEKVESDEDDSTEPSVVQNITQNITIQDSVVSGDVGQNQG